jgi:hypothetical protein
MTTRALLAAAAFAVAHSLALAAPAALAAAPQPIGPVLHERFDDHKVVRVTLRDLRDIRTITALSDDPWTCNWSGQPGENLDFRVPPDALPALDAAGIPYRVLIDNVQQRIDDELASAQGAELLRGVSWFSDYKNLAAISQYADDLVALRPDIASRFIVKGTGPQLLTVGGRSQWGLRLNSPNTPEGVKPALFLNSLQHAREWVTGVSTMFLADTLVRTYDTDPNIKRILDNFDVYLIPVVNPDGYEFTWTSSRLWRKNRRVNADNTIGVDPNRNWAQGWGGPGSSATPSSDIYRGTAAFSEPETANIRDWTATRPNIVFHVDVHAFSQLILEPWGNVFSLPPDTTAFASLSASMSQAMFAVEGKYFYPGPVYRNIYPASGGANDWTYAGRNILGFSFELRDEGTNGFLLPAAQIIPSAREVVAAVDAAADWLLDNPVSLHFPASRPTRLQANASTTVLVNMSRGGKALPASPTLTLFQRIGRTGPFTSSTLTAAGTDEAGPLLSGSLAAGPCSSVTQFYFQTTAADGSTVRIPLPGPDAPFEALASSTTTIFADDFEISRGWTVGDPTPGQADNATSGQWTRTDPNGTFSQPEFDRTPLTGVSALITGQNTRGSTSSTGTVTAGKTTALSPVFDLSASSRAEVSFWLWFCNTRNDQVTATDSFLVDVTSNASAATPTWTNALTVGPNDPTLANLGGWRRYSIDLGSVTTLTSQVRLRFVAREFNPAAVVEAALDDFALVSFSCAAPTCAADFNADGVRAPQDIFDFLNAYFAGSPRADFNNDGIRSPADIFAYLNAYFAGCT